MLALKRKHRRSDRIHGPLNVTVQPSPTAGLLYVWLVSEPDHIIDMRNGNCEEAIRAEAQPYNQHTESAGHTVTAFQENEHDYHIDAVASLEPVACL